MLERHHQNLTRRERQIMDLLYALDEANAGEIQARLPGSPSYSTVRALLRKLVDKGHVRFRVDGNRYVYQPSLKKDTASQGALQRLLDTFFAGSASAAVVRLLGQEGDGLDDAEIDQIEKALDRLKQGRSQG